MSRTAKLGMITLIGLPYLTTLALGQAPQAASTLDAQFPSDHEYVVAVWYYKKDKAATFKYAILDPSIPGNYDRQKWQKAKLDWDDPDKGGLMNIFPVRATQNSTQTERRQIMVRIEEERRRIDFIDKPTVDVKPKSKEKPNGEMKKDAGKTTYGYDPNAKKSADVGSLVGTRWSWKQYELVTVRFETQRYNDGSSRNILFSTGSDGVERGMYEWEQVGNTVSIYPSRKNASEYKFFYKGTVKGETIEVYYSYKNTMSPAPEAEKEVLTKIK